MKALQIPNLVRIALVQRSYGLCEVRQECNADQAKQAHHRRPRGMGGSRDLETNRLSNLLHVCNRCHDWIESNRDAARVGFDGLISFGERMMVGADPNELAALQAVAADVNDDNDAAQDVIAAHFEVAGYKGLLLMLPTLLGLYRDNHDQVPGLR